MNNKKTLWIGDLDDWIDEKYLISLIGRNNLILFINITKNNYNYSYIEFICEEIALKVYNNCYNQTNKLTKRKYRICWAYDLKKIKEEEENIKLFYIKRRRNPLENNFYPNIPNFKQIIEINKRNLINTKQQTQYSIYVGDIDLLTTEQELFEHFAKIYIGCISAKIICGTNGFNKGYGFVYFNTEEDSVKAKYEMRGSILNGNSIKTGSSINKVHKNQIENYTNNVNILLSEFIKQKYIKYYGKNRS